MKKTTVFFRKNISRIGIIWGGWAVGEKYLKGSSRIEDGELGMKEKDG